MRANRQWSDEEDALVEEAIDSAVSCVMEQFEVLIDTLEPESQVLIRAYFDGTPVRKLSSQHGLTVEQVESWLARIRRQLAQRLRTTHRVKQ